MNSDSLLPFQPSLAQATNTRIDSACKHIQQCRVSTDDMMRFAGNDALELQRNKYRYCVHKDELVVGISRPWHTGTAVRRAHNMAYPRVISNLGALGDTDTTKTAIMMIRFMNHFARDIKERKYIIDYFIQNSRYNPPPNFNGCDAFPAVTGGGMGTKELVGMMYDYFAVGYANTLGWAHANSGDTMTSVMIGGLRTVQNGDFEIFAGDLVQFYWTFEKDDFETNGRRKPYIDEWSGHRPPNIDPSTEVSSTGGVGQKRKLHQADGAVIRQNYYDLSYGQAKGVEKLVAKIKPYFPDEENPRINDWFRVFGIAIASARPNEMCDIKISRQSA